MSNSILIQNLQQHGHIRSSAVANAMLQTDRANYTNSALLSFSPYADTPYPIGFNECMSAPHVHAYALELALNTIQHTHKPRILDVGAGSGYLTACFARLVQPYEGSVHGIERNVHLCQIAYKNICNRDSDLYSNKVLTMHCGDGYEGLAQKAPFQFIYVGAAAETPPKNLMDQLADQGRMIIPLAEPRGGQILVEITRHRYAFSQRKLMNVCSCPLIRSERHHSF